MGYTVHGILQARILEWVAFPFPGDLPNPEIEFSSPALQADSLPAKPQGKPIFCLVANIFMGIRGWGGLNSFSLKSEMCSTTNQQDSLRFALRKKYLNLCF